MKVEMWPHQPGDGGILMLPMAKNISTPKCSDWQLVKCPKCGGDCWEGDRHRELIKAEGLVAWCTECALREGMNNEQN